MKKFTVKIEKLGLIEKAEIDVHPLTIFVGENNTNKSWTAYSIFGVFHYQNVADAILAVLEDRRFLVSKKIWKAFESFQKENSLDLSFCFESDFLDKLMVLLGRQFSERNVKSFFRAENSSIFNETCISIKLSEKFKKKIKTKFSKKKISFQFKKIRFTKEKDSYIFFPLGGSKDDINAELKSFSLLQFAFLISRILIENIFPNREAFPAERKGLTIIFPEILSKKEKIRILTRNLLQKELKSKEIDRKIKVKIQKIISLLMESFDVSYIETWPLISDFVQLIIDLSLLQGRAEALNDIAELLSDSLLEGEILPDKGRLYYSTQNVRLDISLASSMVKELSIFYLYLKKMATEDDFLLIDEPEMNLHPLAQVKLLELLSILANRGLTLLITTHTPYMIDHLSNLMEASMLPEKLQDKVASRFYLKNRYSFISPDNVAVYFFDKNGTVKKISRNNDSIIDWETFSKVTQDISSLYSYLLQERNN